MISILNNDKNLEWILDTLGPLSDQLPYFTELAVKDGLQNERLFCLSKSIFEKGIEGMSLLGRDYFTDLQLKKVRSFYERYVNRQRTQADDLLEEMGILKVETKSIE